MRQFKVKRGNHIKSDNSTKKMMYYVLYSLIPIIIFSFYKNGILPVIKNTANVSYILKPLILIIIPVVVSILTEYLYYLIKKDKKSFDYLFNDSFAILPGLFLGLIIPINTPIWLVIIGAIIASLSKMLFGGLGKNILNPALVGGLIIIIFSSSYIGKFGGYLNSYEVEAISGATPLANLSSVSYAGTYEEIVSPYGSLLSMFIGNIPGSLGETSTLLCVMAFVYLVINKVLKWRITVSYVLTAFIMFLIIGLTNNLGLWYSVFCILSGSIIFGSVFMATDPVTSPITKHGQIIGGILLGILTVSIRYLTSFPEGVLISILIFNLLTILINKLSMKYSSNLYKVLSIVIIVVIGLIFTFVIAKNVDYNPNSSVDENFKVTDVVNEGSNTVYYVTSRGYGGKTSIKSKITMNNNIVINFEILSSKESYYGMIENSNYIERIVNNQNNLDGLDVVSGATYTSNYLKEIITKIKEYDRNY